MVATDPTGVMTYVLWHLACHPDVQVRVYDEIVQHGMATEIPQVSAVGELKLLCAVLKEGKRSIRLSIQEHAAFHVA